MKPTNWQGGIEVDGEVIAVCLAGQFISKNDKKKVQNEIDKFPASDEEKREMRSHLDKCPVKDEKFIDEFDSH